MTTSEAPPTFPSLLSRKGTAGRYIFFFFFLLLSFFFFFFQRSLLLKQLGASDSGLWDISERCGSSNEELGIWLEDPAAGLGLHAHRRRAAPANLGTDRVLLIVEKKKKNPGSSVPSRRSGANPRNYFSPRGSAIIDQSRPSPAALGTLLPRLFSPAWNSIRQTAPHPIDHTLIKASWHIHYPPRVEGFGGGNSGEERAEASSCAWRRLGSAWIGLGPPLVLERGDEEEFIQLRLLSL